MIFSRALPAFLLLSLAPIAANAVPITYYYAGAALPGDPGVPAGVTALSGTFTVDLPASNPDPLMNFALLDYDLTDGVTNFNSGSADFAVTASLFLTSVDSQITGFLLQLFWDPFNTVDHPWPVGTAGYVEIRYEWFGENLNLVTYCTTEGPDGTCFGSAVTSSTDAGSLNPVSVPEPGTLLLLGMGLAGLVFARRR